VRAEVLLSRTSHTDLAALLLAAAIAWLLGSSTGVAANMRQLAPCPVVTVGAMPGALRGGAQSEEGRTR